jgi:hypothetical protein
VGTAALPLPPRDSWTCAPTSNSDTARTLVPASLAMRPSQIDAATVPQRTNAGRGAGAAADVSFPRERNSPDGDYRRAVIVLSGDATGGRGGACFPGQPDCRSSPRNEAGSVE